MGIFIIIPRCLFISRDVIIDSNKRSGTVTQVRKVNDNIDMIAAFKGGKIKPLVFLDRGRRIKDFEVLSSREIRYEEVFFKLTHEGDTIY